MRLTREQADILNKLEVGQGIVKLAGRYPEPFPIVIPYFDIGRYVSDDEVDDLMRPVLDAFDKAKQQLFDDKKIGKLHSVHYKSTLIKVAIDLESLAHSLRHFAKENKKKEDNGL